LNEERRNPEGGRGDPEDVDARIEDLTSRIVGLIREAEPEQRNDLREYAIGLLKEGTEVDAGALAGSANRRASSSNPLGIALLLGVVSLPALLLFAPVGLTLLAIAMVMGFWGVGSLLLRR